MISLILVIEMFASKCCFLLGVAYQTAGFPCNVQLGTMHVVLWEITMSSASLNEIVDDYLAKCVVVDVMNCVHP